MLIQSLDREFYPNLRFLCFSSFSSSSSSLFFTQKIYYASFNTHSHAHTDSLPAESQLLAETNAPFSPIYASLCIMPPTLTNTHTPPSKDGAFTSRHHIKPAHKDTHAYHIINIYGYTHADTKPLQWIERQPCPSLASDVLSLPGSHSKTLELPTLQRHANDIW